MARQRGGSLFMAARGPEWGVGADYYPIWHPSRLDPGGYEIRPPNYGLVGRLTRIRRDPDETGLVEPGTGVPAGVFRGRVRPVNWNDLHEPTFIPMLPTWNNLTKGAQYNLRTTPTNKAAVDASARVPVNIGKPLHYTPAPPAKLLKGVN